MSYKVNLTTKIDPKKLKEGTGIIAIESDDYTDKQIKAIKAKGYRVLAYLSIGTIEEERPWFKQFEKYKKKRLEDWHKEYYMDMTKTVWQKFLVNRATALKKRGFDGWWLDNLDVYSEYKSSKEFTACYGLLQKIKKIGGYVMVNGGSEFWDDAIDRRAELKYVVNGYTQEEVFSRITDYSGKGKFGKQNPKDRKFYQELMLLLEKRKINCYMLEYTRDKALKDKIKKWGKDHKVGYCISEDVNL